MNIPKNFWPEDFSFPLEREGASQINPIGLAICDDNGRACVEFDQGEWANFYFECETLGAIEAPSGGLLLQNAESIVVFGKNSYQTGYVIPNPIKSGDRLRFHYRIKLDLAPGNYQVTLGFASASLDAYNSYRAGYISYDAFYATAVDMLRLPNVAKIQVGFGPNGSLSHHGMADLPGEASAELIQPTPLHALSRKVQNLLPRMPHARPFAPSVSALIHVTHWKAGSQWIRKILSDCFPDRIVEPELGNRHLFRAPISEGKIYPTVYATNQQLSQARLPEHWVRFLVIRDLRDTLVSGYFSMRYSHAAIGNVAELRSVLSELDLEQGLLFLIDNWLPGSSIIQLSWIEAGECPIHFEDLISANGNRIFKQVMIEKARLPITEERLYQVVSENQFERLTGRKAGEERVDKHMRKGIIGDWKNYFSDRVKEAFKIRYGGLLAATGYEKDLNW